MQQSQSSATAEDRYRSNRAILIPWLCVSFAIFVYGFAVSLTARHELPQYHHDCALASSIYPQAGSSQPCIYKPGTASLRTNHNFRRHRDSPSADIIYPDGTTAYMVITDVDTDTVHGKVDYFSDISGTQVDGPCWVELWHGKITAVTNAKYRLVSHDNPEERIGGGMSIFLMVTLFVGMVLTCAYLVVLFRRAKAQR